MKKKNLYQLVKQSLKEVLQEQRINPRTLDRLRLNPSTGRPFRPGDPFINPQTGEFSILKPDDIDTELGIPKALAGAFTGTGVGPQKTPDSKEDQLSFTPNITDIDPIDFYSGLGLGDLFDDPSITTSQNSDGNLSFTIWSIDNTADCNLVEITDLWICETPNDQTGYFEFKVNNGPWVPLNTSCAPQSNIADINNPTWAEFTNWFYNDGPSGALNFFGPNGSQPLSEDCPTCTYEEADNSFENAYPFPGNPTPPAGLNYVENNSCIFTACNAPGYSNYFCNNFSDLCNNNEPDLTQLAEVNDTGLCEVTGCLDVDSAYDPTNGLYGLPNNGYICNTPQGTDLCTGGALNDEYTDNNGDEHSVANQINDTTLCNPTPAILGCTFPGYSNYSANNNVENGSCVYNGCLDQFTGGVNNTNWICAAQPSLCDQGIINTEYTVTIVSTTSETGGTFPADYADPDGACEQDDIFGCLDNTEVIPGVLQFPTYNDVHVQNVTAYQTPQEQNDELCGDAVITGCTDPNANNYHCDDINAATGIYECTGGVIPTLSYFSPNVTAGNPLTAPLVVGDPADFCDYDLDDDGVLDADEIVGCTDPNANNYDSTATDIGVLGAFTTQNHIDNGCTYTVYGCTDDTSPAFFDPATLTAPQIGTGPQANTTIVNQVSATDTSDPCQLGPGCTDPNAINYVGNAAAPFTTDDGSCLFSGCANEFANNPEYITSALTQYDGMIANVDDGSCTFEYCNQQGTSNYVCVANPQLCNENGISCGTTPCPLGVPNTEYDSLDNTGTLVTVSITIIDTGCAADGCVDPAANNHDPNATTDDGSCIYRYCDELTAFNYAANRPVIPFNLINNFNQNSVDNSGAFWLPQDIGDISICEFEGCPPGVAQNSTDPSTEVTLNSGIYYSHPNNTGCQTDPNPTNPDYIPGLNSTGQLDPDNEDCCAIAGCIDDGNLGFAGQQFWQQYGYTALGIAAYPGISANNYNPSATPPGDGSCTYNIGCTDPGAPNYDQTAEIDTDTTQCLPYCKKITAFQCSPDPNPNGFAPLNFTKHYITIDCAHIENNTPAVNDEFWNPGGKLFTAPEQIGSPGQPCPSFQAQNFGIQPPPFMAVGYPGQILACNPNSSAGSPQNAPMSGGSAYCPGGYSGCTYIFAAANPDDPKPGQTADTGRWTLYPANTYQTYGGEKDKKPESTQINAVFRIETIVDDFGPNINNLDEWKCGTPPPNTSVLPGGLGIGSLDPKLNKARIDKKINEVEVSKILRKSLTEIFKNKK